MKKSNKIIIGIVAVVMISLVIIFYKIDYPSKVLIYINDEKITLSKNDKDHEMNLSTLNNSKDTKVVVKTLSKVNIKINNHKLINYVSYNMGIQKISEDNRIKIEVKFSNSKKYTTYYINTLPDNFLEYDVENNGNKYSGNYYMTSYTADTSTSYVFKVNNSGDILYYKKCEGFCSQFRTVTSSKNKTRYVYTAQDMSDTKEIDMNNVYGKFIVMDENYKIIDEVKYLENDKSNQDKTYTIFEYLDDNHYLVTSSSREKVSIPNMNELTLIQNNIQEIKDGKVVFEWRSSEHSELYDYVENLKALSKEEANDYLHINKVIVDPSDNNIIASFRNISTILKIDRKTGDIIWALGGKKDNFNLKESEKFAYQHSLSFTSDHSLLIYDNGDNRPVLGIKNQSKVVKINLDEENYKVNSYQSYELKNVYSMAMGSVQVVDEENEVYLISYGTGIFNKGPVQLIDFKNEKTLFSFNLHSNKMMFSSQLAE